MSHITLGTLLLPPDLRWSDEIGWLPVGATVKTTLSGARVVQLGQLQAQRPITLEGGDDFAWITYADLQVLRTMASDPGTYRTLVLPDGRTFTVRFRVEDVAVDAEPVTHRVSDNPSLRDAFQYIPTIRLETVTA